MGNDQEQAFSGFSAESFRFMDELKHNNNKAWFDSNRGRWENLKEELRAAGRSLVPFLSHLDPELETDTRGGRCLGRINRDTRFSVDKSPYRHYIDLLFYPRNSSRTRSPGLALGLTAESCYIGTWRGAEMKDWQQRFIRNVAALPDIFESYIQAQNDFREMSIDSASFVRPKANGLPELADKWTRRKFFYMGLMVPAAEAVTLGRDLLAMVEETFARLYPLLLFHTSEEISPALALFHDKFPTVRV